MVRLTLIWGILLLAGIFVIDIHAQVAVTAPKQSSSSKAPGSTSSKIQTSPTTAHTSSNTTHLTTQAPSNTTLHAPSNTTAQAPSSTTSHAPSNTTTQAPSNTTSHAPSNTTTHPITHTTPVLPTKPSPPTSGHYVVNDTKGTCIIADMGLALELDNATTVKQAKEAKGKWYFNVNPEVTHAIGTCGESRASLHVVFPEGFINFDFLKESKQYYIDEVSVNISWNSAEHWNGTAGKLKLLSTDIGYSVKCKSTPTVKLAGNLYLRMADVKLQAFDISNNKFGKEELCRQDRNIIAVAIGVTVIIVIIIAIIIYFICHKRRSSAYQRI